MFTLLAASKNMHLSELFVETLRDRTTRELKMVKEGKQLALPRGDAETELDEAEAKQLIFKLFDK
jgi:hypothetical protein